MGNGNDNGNDLAQPEQRNAPGGEAAQEAQRSWVTVAEYAVATALATDVYKDVKAAGKAVVDKIRKPPEPPAAATPPGDSASDGEA